MNRGNECEVDFERKAVVVTRLFAKSAGMVGSEQYRQMTAILKEHPDFPVIVRQIRKKENKCSYKKLSFNTMRSFLRIQYKENSEEMRNLEKIIELARDRPGPYAYVKKWFLDNFKNEYLSAQAALMIDVSTNDDGHDDAGNGEL